MAQTDFRTALQSSNELEITVTGRTSGRSLTYPVWFALEGDKLYLIPVRGSDTEWYKNLRKRPSIRLEARGKTLTTSARLLTDEAQIGKVLEKFALPQQESDFACFKKHPLCGLLLRFQPTHRSTNFPSLKMTGSSYYAFQGSDSC